MVNLSRRKIIIITMILTLAIGLSGCISENTEGLVAKVNGDVITQEEFNNDFQVFKDFYEKQYGEDALSQTRPDGKILGEQLKEDILEKLIMEKIVDQENKVLKISVTDEEIEATMANYLLEMGSQEKFDEFLENNDITEEYFKERLRKELLVDKHRDALIKEIKIDEKVAEDYFNDNKEYLVVLKASHILVKSEEDGKKVLEKLKNGESFASLAATESLDTTSGINGGDLGYFTRGTINVEGFEEAAFALDVGEISDLVKTEVGYHIIYLEDRKDSFDILKGDIINLLREDEYLEQVKKIRAKAKVKKYPIDKLK